MLAEPDSKFTRRTIFGSLSRAIWRQDIRLATTLTDLHAAARDHLMVEESKVTLKDPVRFEMEVRLLYAEHAEAKRRELDHECLPSSTHGLAARRHPRHNGGR